MQAARDANARRAPAQAVGACVHVLRAPAQAVVHACTYCVHQPRQCVPWQWVHVLRAQWYAKHGPLLVYSLF